MCAIKISPSDNRRFWVKDDDEIQEYGLRLRVLRHSTLKRHCGFAMAVTETLLVCRKGDCDHVEKR